MRNGPSKSLYFREKIQAVEEKEEKDQRKHQRLINLTAAAR